METTPTTKTQVEHVQQTPGATSAPTLASFLQRQIGRESDQKITSTDELLGALQGEIEGLRSGLNEVVDQVEGQISELKGRYQGLSHILQDTAFASSHVVVMDSNREHFFQSLAGDSFSVRMSDLGTKTIANNCFAGMLTNRSLVGTFVDLPLGSSDLSESRRELRALTQLAELAHQNLSAVFFAVDPRRVMGVDSYSELPNHLQDVMTTYQLGPFHRGLQELSLPHRRRLCMTFNPFLTDTERLAAHFHKQHKPQSSDLRFLDQASWTSSVYALARQIVRNFDQFGWGYHLMGPNATQRVPAYKNEQPIHYTRGLSLGEQLNHHYTLTLYDLLAPDDVKSLSHLGFSPLQRQVKDAEWGIQESIAFADAQTLLPRDSDGESDLNFYNYLGNSLLEDSILRDLVLVTRQFIGTYGTSQENEPSLYACVDDFLGKLIQPSGSARKTKPLEDYKIGACQIEGQTAKLRIKILPLQIIRKVEIELERIKGSTMDVHKEGGGNR